VSGEPVLERGWTSAEVAGELPGLALAWSEVPLAARRRSPPATLFAVQVAGVPMIHVEEALWTCAAILAGE